MYSSKLPEANIYRRETYNYELPSHLIAQFPVEPRDQARLLLMDRQGGKMEDKYFFDIVNYLNPGDTLVLNRSRVIPARLFGYKDSGARVEILLLKKHGDKWETLVKPARKLKAGSRVFFREASVELEVVGELPMAGGRMVQFHNCEDEEAFVDQTGQMPLPPYIGRSAEDRDKIDYQTIYAQESGSVAAPTAGLHFTRDLLEKISNQGVNIARVLLHVGLGTFRPVSTEDIRQHQMHSEYYELDPPTAQILNETRQKGGRIVAVGTTVVRTLETVYNEECGFKSGSGETRKFIYPGYHFQAIDGIVTNFHLPGSSLLMLVAAFAGLDNVLKAYHHAVAHEYRFFSYGDAMLLI